MKGQFEPRRTSGEASQGAGAGRAALAAPHAQSNVSRPEEDDARSSSKYRAALEALFARTEKAPIAEPRPAGARHAKMVSVPTRDDPRRDERDKRLAKLMAAEGHAAVTKTCEAFLNAKLTLPDEQGVMLKLLDHERDDRVRGALESLSKLLDAEAPQRRTVLDARLRRLEDDAPDVEVRDLAASLRKKLARTREAR